MISTTTPPKKSAVILAGREIAAASRLQLATDVALFSRPPGLAAILVGDDPASELYIRLKEQAAREVNIQFHKYLANDQCYSDISEYELLEMINFLNKDDTIDGILVQLPLPTQFDADKIIAAIEPGKDVDGFHPASQVTPPTVGAVIELLLATGEKMAGQKVLLLGHSQKFLAALKKGCQNLGLKKISAASSIPADAATYDIIIIALGQAKVLKKRQVKPGAIIIDIGINKNKAGQTVGDVDPAVATVAGYLSPVPGGVGPLTVACLLRNTLTLAQQHDRPKT